MHASAREAPPSRHKPTPPPTGGGRSSVGPAEGRRRSWLRVDAAEDAPVVEGARVATRVVCDGQRPVADCVLTIEGRQVAFRQEDPGEGGGAGGDVRGARGREDSVDVVLVQTAVI